MPFLRPTLQEVVLSIEADITTRITKASKLLRRSILRVMSRAYGGAVHLQYGNIEYNKDQLFITSADQEFLPIHGSEYGLLQNAATFATGSATAIGTDGKVIPADSELESTTGQSYIVDTAETVTGGIATLSLTAKTEGNDGNEDGGATLSFISPIPGVNSSVTIDSAGLDGGADEEDIEAYRQRTLNRKRRPPHGGTRLDYETWMKEITGVTRSWAIPLYQGVGTIGCAFVRDNDDYFLPSESEIETVRLYIISHTDPITGKTVGIPVTAESGLYMIELTELAVNMTVEVFPNTTTLRTEVVSIMAQLILEQGGPGQTIYKSEFGDAVSSATEEDRHRITLPSGLDYISASTNQIHVLGTITFTDYNG